MMAASNLDFSIPDDRFRHGAERQIAVAIVNDFPTREEIEHTATQNERLRLARELHDGVLNSLAGAALQVQATVRLIGQDPLGAQERLRDIQQMITEQQRELRTWIESMRQGRFAPIPAPADLLMGLKSLCRRATTGSGPIVDLTASDFAHIPPSLVHHVYRLVEESISNIVRHARADTAWVDVRIWRQDVVITVEDDGRGFPFHGRYDLAQLNAKRWGPLTLKERVGLLHGQLVLTSKRSGSRIEMRLPLHRHLGQRVCSRKSSTESRAACR
jgi:signal transduction histidine kinase